MAFLLPIIAKLNSSTNYIQALIIVPSRELAIQIEQIVRKMGSGFKINAVFGGRSGSKDKVELKHIELPGDMQRIMAREAEAEREKRGTIIKSEGEVIASQNLAKAAHIMAKTPGAMQLRTLQTINDIAPDPSQKFIFFPTEFAGMFKR